MQVGRPEGVQGISCLLFDFGCYDFVFVFFLVFGFLWRYNWWFYHEMLHIVQYGLKLIFDFFVLVLAAHEPARQSSVVHTRMPIPILSSFSARQLLLEDTLIQHQHALISFLGLVCVVLWNLPSSWWNYNVWNRRIQINNMIIFICLCILGAEPILKNRVDLGLLVFADWCVEWMVFGNTLGFRCVFARAAPHCCW